VIRCRDVSKHFEASATLKNISFHIHKGEMAYITGPSGAGKTTLLKLLFLHETPDSGEILIDGVDINSLGESEVPFLRRKIGVVFQDFKLLERTAYENVALALRIRGMAEQAVRGMVHEALKLVNLRHKADSVVSTLSGGEQQRVSIARAIVGEPAVLLADEPTGNLDPDTAAGIVKLFKDINVRGTTILHATHDRDLFRGTGYRVFRLDHGGLFPEAGL
jgi:cell division transport system ATP-binding protein